MSKTYLVYPGLGKTTLANKNFQFIDIGIRFFQDLSLEKYMNAKACCPNYRGSPIKTINPKYPNNIKEYIKTQIACDKTILMAFKKDSINIINSLGITDYKIVLPGYNRLKQLRQDYIKRGDNAKYIENNLTERYNHALNLAKNLGNDIIFLKSGEYFEDVI